MKAVAKSIKLKIDYKDALIEKIKDSEEDQRANHLERERGRNNPTCDCYYLMKDLLP